MGQFLQDGKNVCNIVIFWGDPSPPIRDYVIYGQPLTVIPDTLVTGSFGKRLRKELLTEPINRHMAWLIFVVYIYCVFQCADDFSFLCFLNLLPNILKTEASTTPAPTIFKVPGASRKNNAWNTNALTMLEALSTRLIV